MVLLSLRPSRPRSTEVATEGLATELVLEIDVIPDRRHRTMRPSSTFAILYVRHLDRRHRACCADIMVAPTMSAVFLLLAVFGLHSGNTPVRVPLCAPRGTVEARPRIRRRRLAEMPLHFLWPRQK